jgi:MFS family permease
MAFCSGWSLAIFTSLFGAYLSEENAVDLAVAGRLLVLIGVLSVGSGVLWGGISDRVGRGRAFLLVFSVRVIVFAFFWLWPVMAAFVLSSVLMGLTLRGVYTVCAASAGDYVPVRFAASAFGIIAVGAGIGGTLSPVIGGLMADTIGMSWAFSLALGTSVVGIAAGALLHRLTSPPRSANARRTPPNQPGCHGW